MCPVMPRAKWGQEERRSCAALIALSISIFPISHLTRACAVAVAGRGGARASLLSRLKLPDPVNRVASPSPLPSLSVRRKPIMKLEAGEV